MRARLLLPLLLCGTAALAQPFAYQDADNPSQAAGTVHALLVVSRTMLAECARRQPALEDEMLRNLHARETREHAVILKAEYAWWRVVKQDPALRGFNVFARVSAEQKLKNFDDAPLEDAAKAQYIADETPNLDSRIWTYWRSRSERFDVVFDAQGRVAAVRADDPALRARVTAR
ncbi:MAG: hypothetical protein QM772_10475 [Ottowia sp.]|uniref:hypothetical protein n=1 Tax=Ottowia sp. TaxID=1898956 RepID=UPI0039E72391